MGSLRVTICVPTRDRAGLLAQAIASVLSEPLDGLELLVCDDASSDETPELIAGLGDDRVRYLRHRQPIGVAANRNSAIAAARGRFIAWLDDDDERLAGGLAAQLALLEGHPEVALVHGGRELIDGDGARLPDWRAPFATDTIEPPARAFMQLLAANEVTTSTVLVRRDDQLATGRFDPSIGPSSTDWEMWCRLALRGAVGYVAAPVARYRQHAATISSATTAAGERLRCNARVVERVLARDRELIGDPVRARAIGAAGLAAQALLHAGDAYTRGDREAALHAVDLARAWSSIDQLRAVRAAYAAGDDAATMVLTRRALEELAGRLHGTRYGARLAAQATRDPDWERQLRRAGQAAAARTPRDAVIAAIAKWDPTVIRCSHRAGLNYPDRTLLQNGYPADGDAAVAHLEQLRAGRGITHLVVPQACGWWLTEYPELSAHVGAPLYRDDDCCIYALP